MSLVRNLRIRELLVSCFELKAFGEMVRLLEFCHGDVSGFCFWLCVGEMVQVGLNVDEVLQVERKFLPRLDKMIFFLCMTMYARQC